MVRMGLPLTEVDGGYPTGGRRERAAGAAWRATVIGEEPEGAASLAPASGHSQLERFMHVERSARCMDIGRKRHPGVGREPELGSSGFPLARE